MILKIQEDKLIAVLGTRNITLEYLTPETLPKATSVAFGISLDLAYEVLDTGLRIGRLLKTKEHSK